MSTPDRSKFLGGSDAAAVMGLSPWSTPLELFFEKTKQKPKPEPDAATRKRHERGHKLEPFIRDMAVDKLREMGLTVEHVATNERYQDAEHDFLACEIDFELVLTGNVQIGEKVYTLDGERINCDAKSVTGFARKKWGETSTEDVPIEYAAQFMHGLGITGRRFCLVAALRSFDDVDVFWTVRDDETVTAMRARCVEFWTQHVLTGIPPDPLNFSDIKALFPLDNGCATEADEETANKVERLRACKAEIKKYEELEDSLTFDIGEAISPNARLTYQGRDIATWKAQGRTDIDQTALKEERPDIYALYIRTKTIRVLRLPKPKK